METYLKCRMWQNVYPPTCHNAAAVMVCGVCKNAMLGFSRSILQYLSSDEEGEEGEGDEEDEEDEEGEEEGEEDEEEGEEDDKDEEDEEGEEDEEDEEDKGVFHTTHRTQSGHSPTFLNVLNVFCWTFISPLNAHKLSTALTKLALTLISGRNFIIL